MAIGDVTAISPDASAIEVLASVIAANGAPAGAVGVSLNDIRAALGALPKKVRAAIVSTAGSGVMTAAARVWLHLGAIGWVVAATLNAGAAIAETGADTIGYSEIVDAFDTADRVYIEITAIAGTATAVKGLIAIAR